MTASNIQIALFSALDLNDRAEKIKALQAVLRLVWTAQAEIRKGYIGRLEISQLDLIGKSEGLIRGHLQHLNREA